MMKRSRFTTVHVTTSVLVLFIMGQVAWSSASVNSSPQKRVLRKQNSTTNGNIEVSRTIRKIVSEKGKDVELLCPIATQHVEWYKQNPVGRERKKITHFRNRYEVSSGIGKMRIRSVIGEDSGTYICKVANKSDMHFIQLVVSGEQLVKNNHLKPPPNRNGGKNREDVYSEPHIDRNVLPREPVHRVANGFPFLLLKCESTGNPKPTITWFKNGNIISSSTGNVSTLKLLNLSQADNGMYRCESENLFGVSTYEIKIHVTDYRFGTAEILQLTPRNVSVPEGSPVNISCVAKFELDPWFRWVRKVSNNKTESGKVFFHSGTSAFYEVLKSSTVRDRGDGTYATELFIPSVTRNDSGEYFCAVAGLQGYNLSDATITVLSDSSLSFRMQSKGAAAQWAILWTISFILLVMLVVGCSVKLYGCRRSKPSSTKPPPSSSTVKSQCNLPESSPLTMSTHCTTQGPESFAPLIVGSSSGLSSFVESDYDSPCDASNSFVYPQSQFSAASSWASNNDQINNSQWSPRSYRPNSICSDYSSVSRSRRDQSYLKKETFPRLHHLPSNPKVNGHRSAAYKHQRAGLPKKYNMQRYWEGSCGIVNNVEYCQSTDCESCVSDHCDQVMPIDNRRKKKNYPRAQHFYDYRES